MIDPKRYTIIDFRALEALGSNRTWHTVDSYLAYLAFCRALAHSQDVSLRELDRALWKWSEERSALKSVADRYQGRKQAIERLKKLRRPLPRGFIFDREEANER